MSESGPVRRGESPWSTELPQIFGPPRVIDDRLYADPDLVQFYDLDNVWGPDDDWCVRFAEGARSVLDLGCGTGRLAAALAAGGRSVVGVEPAVAMLEVARRRSGGEGVAWVEADAREVRLGRCFDAVLLTGHAFQVFLTGADQRAVLRTVAAHLGPEGRFVLDTRNPEAKAWRAWRPGHSERVLDHPRLGKVKAWNDAAHDAATGVVTYRTFYQAEGEEQLFSATSRIGFASKEELAGLLDEAGLFAAEWLGGWSGEAFGPGSPEIIPVGRLRPRGRRS